MILLIILTVVFGIVVVGLSIVYYVEQKEVRIIKRYNYFRKIGLEESAYITYQSSKRWIGFGG